MMKVLQAKTTKTAVFDGSSVNIDNTVHASVPDWTLVIDVQELIGDTVVRFEVTDSVNGFTNSLASITLNVAGACSASCNRRYSFSRRDFPSLRLGTANAVLRLSIKAITGTTPSVTYASWLEY